jgi:hypothetical protein
MISVKSSSLKLQWHIYSYKTLKAEGKSKSVGSSIAPCAVLLPVIVRLHTAALWWRVLTSMADM